MTRAVLVWTWFVVDVGSTPLVSPPWRDIPAGSYPPALRARPLGNLLIILTAGMRGAASRKLLSSFKRMLYGVYCGVFTPEPLRGCLPGVLGNCPGLNRTLARALDKRQIRCDSPRYVA